MLLRALALSFVAALLAAQETAPPKAAQSKAAQDAKAGCPVSKALTGVDITLDAALEG